MPAIRLTGNLICATPDEAEAVLHALPAHVAATRAEPGCLWFSVVRSAEDPLVWEVEERFADRAAFEAHQIRTRASAWFRATGGIRRDYRITEG